MIKKLANLPEQEIKQFYRQLTARLLEIFGMEFYESEEDLQKDFHEWKNSDRKDYHNIVDSILSEIAPRGIKLTWRDLIKLNYKRWHLCKVCGNPFIAYDKFNTTKICYGKPYMRYKVGEGSFFKACENGKSVCFMAYKASYANRKEILKAM